MQFTSVITSIEQLDCKFKGKPQFTRIYKAL